MTEKLDVQTKIELFKIAAQLTKLAVENEDLQPSKTKYENDLFESFKKYPDKDGSPKVNPPPEKPTIFKFFQGMLLDVQQSFYDFEKSKD